MAKLRGKRLVLGVSINLPVVNTLERKTTRLWDLGLFWETNTGIGSEEIVSVRRIGAFLLHGTATWCWFMIEVGVSLVKRMDILGMVVSMVALALLLVVVDPRCQAYIILHVRRKEDRVPSTLLQHVQRRHLRRGEAVNLQILCTSSWVKISETAQRCHAKEVRMRVLGVGISTPRASTQTMEKQARLHTLHLFGLLFAPRPVFVVGMIMEMLQPETFGFLYKGTLVQCTQSFPGLA